MSFKVCTKCNESKLVGDFDQFRDRGKIRVRGHCKSCRRLMVKDYDSQNREKKKSYNKTYHKENLESRLAYSRNYHETNREKILAYLKWWREQNPHKVAKASSQRAYHIQKATPHWLSEEDLLIMKGIYMHAKDCNLVSEVPYEVDHIVPIKNPVVCGLNVPWNLQILPKDLNRSKGNKFDAEAEQIMA